VRGRERRRAKRKKKWAKKKKNKERKRMRKKRVNKRKRKKEIMKRNKKIMRKKTEIMKAKKPPQSFKSTFLVTKAKTLQLLFPPKPFWIPLFPGLLRMTRFLWRRICRSLINPASRLPWIPLPMLLSRVPAPATDMLRTR